MKKYALGAIAASAIILAGPAFAAMETWLVTEENAQGVKGSQGKWTIDHEGDKLSGDADLLGDDGSALTYKLEGSVANNVYTIAIKDCSDGKKGCVWSGHAPVGGGAQIHGLLGYAECEDAKLVVRASILGR